MKMNGSYISFAVSLCFVLRYIEKFGSDFVKAVKEMMKYELTESVSLSYRTALFEEILYHSRFCKTKVETFCGREKILSEVQSKLGVIFTEDRDRKPAVQRQDSHEEKLESHRKQFEEDSKSMVTHLENIGVHYVAGDSGIDVESGPNYNPREKLTMIPEVNEYHRPVIVSGNSGSGKTALMAKLAQLSSEWFHGSVTVMKFMGTSAMSATIRAVLVSVCKQIWHVYKITPPTDLDIEGDYQFLVRYFAALLWQLNTKDRPLMIVLDSVDQLTEVDHAHMFNWLPHRIPLGVYMLVSVVTDRTNCLQNVKQVFPFPEQYVKMSDLESHTASDIISAFCQKSKRHLARKQKNLLLELFAKCSQPLYLKLLLDMSLSWKSHTRINQGSLGATVREAINHLFENLERNHGEKLVQKGIGRHTDFYVKNYGFSLSN